MIYYQYSISGGRVGQPYVYEMIWVRLVWGLTGLGLDRNSAQPENPMFVALEPAVDARLGRVAALRVEDGLGAGIGFAAVAYELVEVSEWRA